MRSSFDAFSEEIRELALLDPAARTGNARASCWARRGAGEAFRRWAVPGALLPAMVALALWIG